jgi:hypothetical protein
MSSVISRKPNASFIKYITPPSSCAHSVQWYRSLNIQHTTHLPYPDAHPTTALMEWRWGKAEPDTASISISADDYVPNQPLVTSIQSAMKAAYDKGYRSVILQVSKDGITASSIQVCHFAKVCDFTLIYLIVIVLINS